MNKIIVLFDEFLPNHHYCALNVPAEISVVIKAPGFFKKEKGFYNDFVTTCMQLE